LDVIDDAFASFEGLTVGDFNHRELPAEVNESVERAIDAFASAGPKEREEIVARVERTFAFIFDRYARLASVEAVRRNNPGLLARGLIALAIEDAKPDWRDTLQYLAFIYRSACKLNIDPSKLFHETGQIALPPFRRLLEGFLGRDEDARTIESFHWKETGEADAFAYVYVQPPPYRGRAKIKLKLDSFFRRLRSAFPGIFNR
jgi:hypothetical protein